MASIEDFEEIALPHLDKLYSFAYYLAGEEAEAKDILQETMKKTMENIDRYEKGTNFKAWASRIMRNLFIDRTRKKKPSSTDFEKYEPASREGSQPWPEVEFISDDELLDWYMSDQVKDALQELPEKYRSALLLNTVHDLSYEDISEVMDCPMGTVMSRLYRARQELKRKLSEFASERGFQPNSSSSSPSKTNEKEEEPNEM